MFVKGMGPAILGAFQMLTHLPNGRQTGNRSHVNVLPVGASERTTSGFARSAAVRPADLWRA